MEPIKMSRAEFDKRMAEDSEFKTLVHEMVHLNGEAGFDVAKAHILRMYEAAEMIDVPLLIVVVSGLGMLLSAMKSCDADRPTMEKILKEILDKTYKEGT